MSEQKLDPQTEPRSKPRAQPRTGQSWTRWLRRIAGGLLVLLVVLVGVAAFLVGTAPGGRITLSIAERFLPEDAVVEIEHFDGRLINRFELQGVTLRIPTLEAEADRLALDWRGIGILRKKVHVRTLVVEGLDLRLIESDADSLPDEPDAESAQIVVLGVRHRRLRLN